LPTRVYLAFVFAIADRMSNKAMEHLLAKSAMDVVRAQSDELMREKKEDLEKANAELIRKNVVSTDAVIEALPLVRAKDADPKLVDLAIDKLKAVIDKDPTNARAALILGRLYRWKRSDLDMAIQILTRTIDSMTAAGLNTTGQAAIRYNRACYNVLRATGMGSTARPTFLQDQKVQDDLRVALSLDPTVVDDLQRDMTEGDFASLREELWFQEMIKEFAPATRAAEPPKTETSDGRPAQGSGAAPSPGQPSESPRPLPTAKLLAEQSEPAPPEQRSVEVNPPTASEQPTAPVATVPTPAQGGENETTGDGRGSTPASESEAAPESSSPGQGEERSPDRSTDRPPPAGAQ
jgi:hypothetical protein